MMRAIDVTQAPTTRVPAGVKEYPKDYPADNIVFWFSQFAEQIPQWGTNPVQRDLELRNFWPSEPNLASAFGSQIIRYATFPYVLDGPSRTTAIYDSILNAVEDGEGWQTMMVKVVQDLYCQDNGAFIEIIRAEDSPTSPMVSLRHMDAGQCRRTGRPDEPVIYWDFYGRAHIMKWYQVILLSELPSPIQRFRGLQLSVLSRILKAAQIIKSIYQFRHEEVSGLKHHKLHLLGGFNQDILDSTLEQKLAAAKAQGFQNYVDPVLLATLSPNGQVTHEEIDLNALPRDFNEDVAMRLYIQNIALAWEDDYTSFAPIHTTGLGGTNQAETMSNKSRSRGPKAFMNYIEHKFNYAGVLPSTVKISYGEQDPIADMQKLQQGWRFAQMLNLLITAQVLTPEVAAFMLRDAGFLRPDYIAYLGIDHVPDAIVDSARPLLSIEPDPSTVVTDPNFVVPAQPSNSNGNPKKTGPPGVTSVR